VAANWHELMIPQRTMRSFIARVNEQLDTRLAAIRHASSRSATFGIYSCDLRRSYPVLRLFHYVQRWCAYLLRCASTHCTASTGVGREPIGCHISWPQICPGSRYFLAHGWVGVLTCKGVRQNSASPKGTSLMSNLGAGCESSTWDHSTQYWFATN